MENTPLSKAKVGDTLIFSPGSYYALKKVTKILRLTTTQIITEEGRFRRDTGYAPRNQGYLRSKVSLPENEAEIQKVLDAYEANHLRQKIGSVKWGEVSLPLLRDLKALLKL